MKDKVFTILLILKRNFVSITQKIMLQEETNQLMFLKFTTQVHPFPFLDSTVEVAVELSSDSGRIIHGREVPFRICLQYSDDTNSILDKRSFEILNPSAQVICAKTGKSPIIQVRLLTTSSHKRDFVLRVFPNGANGANAAIAPDSSKPMQVVRHRVEIWNEDKIQTVWFKDEGGKSNQIILQCRLVNASGHTVTNRTGIRLKCTLYYEDGDIVGDQKILKISNDTNLYLGPDGLATIRCQIKQISQTHDCRKFRVRVSADTLRTSANSDVSDISYQETPDILVKSKISKKNREKKLLLKEHQERGSVLLPPAGDRPTSKKRKCSDAGGRGRAVRSISPTYMMVDQAKSSGAPGAGEGAESAAVTSSLALLQFSEMAVRNLQALQFQLQQQQHTSSTSSTSSPLSPLGVIDDILSFHKQLGLPSPSLPDPSDLSFEEVYDRVDASGEDLASMLAPPLATDHSDAQGVQEMDTMDTETGTGSESTGATRSHGAGSASGSGSGELDTFRRTAGDIPGLALGPVAIRGHSLSYRGPASVLGPDTAREGSFSTRDMGLGPPPTRDSSFSSFLRQLAEESRA